MATQPQTIRSGESAAQSIKDKGASTYHHTVKGAKFIMPDGLEVHFLGGRFVTSDPEIIAELDKIANKPTSMIFTKPEVAASIADFTKKSASDAVQTAAKAE